MKNDAMTATYRTMSDATCRAVETAGRHTREALLTELAAGNPGGYSPEFIEGFKRACDVVESLGRDGYRRILAEVVR